MSVVFFDLETLHPKGEESFQSYAPVAGVSVACLIDDATGAPTFFTSNDEPPFDINGLVARLNGAETVVSYNGESFDTRVLEGCATEPLMLGDHVDLWLVVKDVTDAFSQSRGFFYRRGERKLDVIARHTLGEGKLLADGALAPTKWRDGRIGEVVSYCWKDVELLRKLWHFIHQHHYIVDCHGNAIEVEEL